MVRESQREMGINVGRVGARGKVDLKEEICVRRRQKDEHEWEAGNPCAR